MVGAISDTMSPRNHQTYLGQMSRLLISVTIVRENYCNYNRCYIGLTTDVCVCVKGGKVGGGVGRRVFV